MSLSLYNTSVPVFKRMLSNLNHCLDKARTNALVRKFDIDVLVNYRLAPDMLPFAAQIQIACDSAKFGAARTAGLQAPKSEDEETTLEQLQERITKTLVFLDSIQPKDMNGKEDIEVTFPVGKEQTRTLRSEDYIKHWAISNMYFHTVMAYAILRHNGIDLGKTDYLLGKL